MVDHHSQGSEENRPNTDYDRFRRAHGTVLFVGNLPFHTPWQHVKDHFRNAGTVLYTDLIADRSGRPKGSALVTMMTEEAAENAIRMFNEMEYEGRHLIVRKFDDGPRPPLVRREMMPPYGTSAVVRRRPYGPTNNATGFYDGQGTAYPRTSTAAAYCRSGYRPGEGDDIKHMSPAEGCAEQLPRPRSHQTNQMHRKLFVSNLPFDCTASALRETFQQVGVVERAEIITGRSGKSRGMGVVVMKTTEEARVAIEEFDGIEMASRAMSVRLDSRPQ